MISEKTTAKLREAKRTALDAGHNVEEPSLVDHDIDTGDDLPVTKNRNSMFDYDFDYEPAEIGRDKYAMEDLIYK